MDNHRNRDSAETEVQVGSPDLQVRVTVIGRSLHKDDDIGDVSIFNLNADLAKDPTEVPEDEIKKDGLALGVWRKAVRSASVCVWGSFSNVPVSGACPPRFVIFFCLSQT